MKRRSDFRDLTGLRFGRLVVVKEMPKLANTQQSIWHCRCDCGEERFAIAYGSLVGGKTKSCGCLRRELAGYDGRPELLKATRNPLYCVWLMMRQRCGNPKNGSYARYGGRGIRVCERWEKSFEDFVADMGRRPDGTTLDRRDNDGNYEPGNCRWETPITQSHNRNANSRLMSFEWNGEELCVKEICRREDVGYEGVLRAVKKGLPVRQAVLAARGVKSRFVEDTKTHLMELVPKHRLTKRKLRACGDLPPDDADALAAQDAWLWKCIERCDKLGIKYRGPVPADWDYTKDSRVKEA